VKGGGPGNRVLHTNQLHASFWQRCGHSSVSGCSDSGSVTLNKLECLKQAFALNTLAWNNKMGFDRHFVGSDGQGMINRDSWGHQNFGARGEILRFPKD
jgi:hypothetical protein